MAAKRVLQGPSKSEYLLYQIWDLIDRARLRGGEEAATALAERALQAIEIDTHERTS